MNERALLRRTSVAAMMARRATPAEARLIRGELLASRAATGARTPFSGPTGNDI